MNRHSILILLLACFVYTSLAATSDAQLLRRRFNLDRNDDYDDYREEIREREREFAKRERKARERSLKDMEEYYDDLEDYYEKRDPRLAREAERMEKYYEDLRKGRRTGRPPVVVGLPRVQGLIEQFAPAIIGPGPGTVIEERSVLVPNQPVPAETATPNGRWQAWGATPPAAQVNEPTPSPKLAEAYRVPSEPTAEGGLVPPPSGDFNPPEQLGRSVTALRQDLQRLAQRSPNSATQWLEYLSVPTPDGATDASEYYNTQGMRARLKASLTKFDRVAGDPQFAAVNKLDSFDQTRNSLKALLAWLDQQPTLAAPPLITPEPTAAEELPTPPQN